MDRKKFLELLTLGSVAISSPVIAKVARDNHEKPDIKFGLVTYQWGKDWDIPTLIKNLTKSKNLGVELRVDHAHGVDTFLTSAQRECVKKQFKDSPVTLVGFGSNVQFDSPVPGVLNLNIKRAKALIALDHDIGGSGVKVKPNQFHKDVPKEKTIEQIGKSLNEIGKFAGDLGQKVRLEVHGPGTQELPNIKAILDVADNPNVGICWNCNPTDLNPDFQTNFDLVKNRLGSTIHIHELDIPGYPYDLLFKNLVGLNYNGWLLFECSATDPADKVKALDEQRQLGLKMLSQLKAR